MKTFLAIAALLCAAALTQAQFTQQANPVPAFHPTAPSKAEAVQIAAYKAVAKAPNVMYQEPCYCYCDRGHGHTSLHSCFESTHGANCGVCMGEALYSYKMSKKGWSPKMIRDGIIRGDWKQMDLQHPEPVN